MKRDLILSLIMLAFGTVLMVHCPRAAIREYRNGVAKGKFGAILREADPIGFWFTLIMTFVAGLMGFVFVVLGGLFLWANLTDSQGFRWGNLECLTRKTLVSSAASAP